MDKELMPEETSTADFLPPLPVTDGREHNQKTVLALGQWLLRNYNLVKSLTTCPAQAVDVEAMKVYEYDQADNLDRYSQGWNDCIDHLAAQGHLTQPNAEGDILSVMNALIRLEQAAFTYIEGGRDYGEYDAARTEAKTVIRTWYKNATTPKQTEAGEWKPIETAPKDGRRILLLWDIPLTGRWLDNTETKYPWAGWKPEGMHAVHGHPTHWMPLPDYAAQIKAIRERG